MSVIKLLDYLPSNFIDVAEILTEKQIEKLLYRLGGCTVYVPLPCCLERFERDKKIRADYNSNLSYRQLARRYNLSENTIRTILSL